jgi:hypothetical protein
MIRKLGSMGKLARRNSLAGITSLFKDKKDKEKNDDDADSGKKGKKKAGKSGKGEASEASVSHVTAELDRASSGDWTAGAELSGLSPAAKLARQHTLKSNAEAAARAKAAQEASASATVRANGTPATWEKNTTTRQGSPIKGGGGVARVNEDGTRVFVEDDDSPSEDGSDDGHYGAGNAIHDQGWGEDEEWGGEGEGEEDLTIRAGLERASIDREGYGEEDEVWAVGARRSVEKARKPAKGILKCESRILLSGSCSSFLYYVDAGSYDQLRYLAEQASPSRVRSNSYNSHPGQTNELGPLARIPSPDPDHIDGLHKHPSYSSSHSAVAATPTIPPFMFESSPGTESPKEYSSTESLAPHPPEKSLFNHPNLNSSAPALSTMLAAGGPPTLTHRSATAPAKRLAFASNLSVYDTFSSTVYDRRSEPATWSRLTPALAQRIKEELNSYKMEEMEVHAASRIQ